MKNFKSILLAGFLVGTMTIGLQAKDVLLEVKGAYFLSTDDTFKAIYDNGCGEVGLEATAEITHNIYAFTSIDFFNKSGITPIFATPSQFFSLNFGFGLKYFIECCDHCDIYVGLGAQPTYLRTIDSSTFLTDERTAAWSLGGIAKFGAIIDITHSLFIDLFIDYSFVTFDFNSAANAPVQRQDAILNGALFGAGFGYRFN
ncbi:hypothetical protein [Candidatus Chromulinivorax destructor]|uniref:Outer membrane protein beta-barrel domain-containing protein n=1 Tax=Candidatus Chromulinivorax destructor TaxID=2066483 RepID=A0A345ZBL7_9BACT|nr:hypothetical protein [Candidatus Chromulinivorax destructor]AXK60684.1 hypothetical protein C0J27_02930 [Candidatus Chromulinivorax destructor]